jgi:chromosomal replication initiation ATPase DnaA
MTEEEIKNELADNERIAMKCVCDTLLNYEGRVRNYLADFVASLCNVETERMFSDDNHLDVAQARWLFWYAYRYMTNETYEKIGKLSGELYGKAFTKVGVASSVNKMNMMIEQQPIWKKRWTIVKRIIKLQSEMVFEPQIPITISIPKNVELTIKKV